MPILLNDYDWKQTKSEIIISVKFKEKLPRNVDVFTHKNYVKINSSPYFFEKFLENEINTNLSRCRILDYEIIFHLIKADNSIHWNNLEKTVDKNDLIKFKEKIIEDAQKLKEEEIKRKIELKEKKKRADVHKEIERDAKIRECIENFEKFTCENEMKSIEKLKKDSYKELFYKPNPEKKKQIKEPENIKILKEPVKKIPKVPNIRSTGEIKVNFTKRNFCTPQRESQEPEEMEWLTKQHEARKSVG